MFKHCTYERLQQLYCATRFGLQPLTFIFAVFHLLFESVLVPLLLLRYVMSHYRRDRNVITEVRNQKTCGACWAFSTAATIEAMYAIKTGLLHKLSVQEVSVLLGASLQWYAVICDSGLLYRGVSKSSWTELMTKCMLTFVVVSYPFPNLCSRSSFSVTVGSTAKTDFWELLIGQSMVDPEFQGILETMSLWQQFHSTTQEAITGPNRVRRVGDHSHV
jgi:hypothetical protein